MGVTAEQYAKREKELDWQKMPNETIQEEIARFTAKWAAFDELSSLWQSLSEGEQRKLMPVELQRNYRKHLRT